MAEVKEDATLAAAVEVARAALDGVVEAGTLGEHIGFVMDAERLGTHYFTCLAPGYPGWSWAVTVARAPRLRTATVCETELVPGPDALLSPAWVPYQQRLKPGDIGPGDATPYVEDDPHLEAGFEATGEEDVDQMALFELGLGRRRVLSARGREAAGQRWFEGERGPAAASARKADAMCSTCGYLVPMPGVLRQSFGVCANEWSPADGAVVALSFGCGAHSEVDAPQPDPLVVDPPVLDEYALEVHETQPAPAAPGAGETVSAEAAAQAPGADEPGTEAPGAEPTALPEPHQPSIDTSEGTEEQARG